MSRHKKILPIDLTETVDAILAEYGDEVFDVLGDAIKQTSIEARNDLRDVRDFSPNGNPSGDYSKNWEYEMMQVSRLEKKSVVYNEQHYRLTHLLESGHSKWLWGRNSGGKVQGYPHIAPINDKAQERVVELVEEKINKI